MTKDAVVYDRTSGDEGSTGQDPRAQLALTVELATRAGFVVRASHGDADVSGDVPWGERPGFRLAARDVAMLGGAVLFVREVSRLWRGEPARGLIELERVSDLEVHGEPVFSRRGGAWVRDGDADHLVRFVALWGSWSEKRRVQTRTAQAMAEIVSGRRATKSGRRPGRPAVVVDPDHLAAAAVVYRRTGSMAEAHRELLKRRGWYDAKDSRTQKARNISKAKTGELLGVYSVGNSDASETPDALTEPGSVGMVSLADGLERTKTEVERNDS